MPTIKQHPELLGVGPDSYCPSTEETKTRGLMIVRGLVYIYMNKKRSNIKI